MLFLNDFRIVDHPLFTVLTKLVHGDVFLLVHFIYLLNKFMNGSFVMFFCVYFKGF